ncbi:MAG: YcaQ family DNA glycosylase, partial [Candidatus Eremiobacteraeota bacterium]|nr:YcaQ family DNA glycosylase [Candidatus Eremiobacteraeota bacterium]
GSVARIAADRPDLVRGVRARIATDGPLAASDFEGARSEGSWWGWSETKRALEYLFWSGDVTTRRRRTSFEREYDLVERVVPSEILARTIDERTAQRELVRVAAGALGIATERDLRDYFRLDVADAKRAVGDLVEAGDLAEVAVEGWRDTAYACPPLRIPRRAAGSAFLSPFDNAIWNRPRAERLFGFDYRLEIYTPLAKRVHGYYVLPYLVDGRLVARADLKHDRAAETLRAHAGHLETGSRASAIAERLRRDLAELAAWLGATRVAAPPNRDWR